MSCGLTFILEQQGPDGSFSHFCALQCWHTYFTLAMVTLSLLA